MTTVSNGQTSAVSSGQIDIGWIVLAGGTLSVFGSGVISNTAISGGIDNISAGGGAIGTTIFGGGEEVVFSGGVTISTTVENGGTEFVSSGGSAIGTTILSGGSVVVSSGGTLELLGADTASGATIRAGGTLEIGSGNTLSGYAVTSGATLVVASGGTVINATVSGGGTLELASAGATANGPITLAGSGATLRIDATTMPANVISGFAVGDTIDLAGVSFGAGGMAGLAAGNVLQVVAGGQTHSLQLDPSANFAGDSFRLSSDGHGGTDVSLNRGFSINVTYDPSVTSAANAAAIEGAVAAAVQFYESVFTNPMTLNIDVGFGEINGNPISATDVAMSKTNRISTTYAAITAAMSAGAISADQIAAAAGLPAGNPTSSGTFVIARSEAKALGLLAGSDDSIIDGYVGLSSATTFTFDPNNRAVTSQHDAIGAFEHEISEVMGRVGSLGQHNGSGVYTPIDLFRYSAVGVRQLVYGPGYFSINGQTLLTQYNDPNDGADAVDWIPGLQGDSYGGNTTGVASLVGATDLEEMNVLGYDVAFAGTVSSGVTLTVSAGQTDTSLIVLSGGTVNVLSGGIVIDTLDSGGAVNISSGGAASGTAVFSGGKETVFFSGTATATTVNNGGFQVLVGGGVTSTTSINIGGTMVTSSGAFNHAFDNGAIVFTGNGRHLSGVGGAGVVIVSSGSLALSLASGSTFSGSFVVSGGGTLEVTSAGAAAGRPVDFAGTSTILRVDGAAMPSDVISGFAPNETIDLAGLSFDSSGIATVVSGNVLQVVENSQTFDLNLDPAQSFTGQRFLLSTDGASGTDIAVTSPVVSSGQVLSVSSGQAGSGIVVQGGGTLNILSGSTESGATISSGGAINVPDGGTLAGNVADGGTVTYDVSGSATFSGTLTGGGTLVVSGGGHLDVVSAYAGAAQIDDTSTLEFTGTYAGAATFSGAPTGPGGTLKFDAGSTGPITVVNPNDTVIAQGGNGDWIDAIVSYTLPTNVDTLFLFAGTQGTGNSDAAGDALYAIDASHTQTLTGNSGNDAFVVYNSADAVVPKAGSHDTVYAAVNYTLPTGIDVLLLEAGTKAVGNSDAAGDVLYAADASIAQTLTGNSGNDVFVVYNSADVVVPKAGSHDVVYSAVNYTLPIGLDVLFLEAGTQAAGNSDAAGDALYAADAGIAQTLTGHSHNDVFVIYNSADVVIGQASSTDTVYAAANFTLPTNVDTLFLEGSGATHGTGNGDAVDALFGNAGVASTLIAGSGADTLYVTGAAGTIMTGGTGHDTFAFPNAMGHDEVTNFGLAKDTLQFNATLFANFTAAMSHASQVGANTVFTIDVNDTVTLDNVTKTSLTAGNFHFS